MRRPNPKASHLRALLQIAMLISIGGYSSSFAQGTESNERAARRIDEYQLKDLRGHDEQMRLWGASDEFVKQPETARLFIIAYGNLPGRARRYATRAKNYLVRTHSINAARVITIDGGFRRESSIEIWTVPTGTLEPLPVPNGTFEHHTNVAWKYDEYSLDGWWFGDYGSCCEREPERLDGLAAFLNSNKNYSCVMIVHRGITNCETCMKPGTEFGFAEEERNYLIKNHQIAPSRVSIVKGRKDHAEIEYWVVPYGVGFPKTKN